MRVLAQSAIAVPLPDTAGFARDQQGGDGNRSKRSSSKDAPWPDLHCAARTARERALRFFMPPTDPSPSLSYGPAYVRSFRRCSAPNKQPVTLRAMALSEVSCLSKQICGSLRRRHSLSLGRAAVQELNGRCKWVSLVVLRRRVLRPFGGMPLSLDAALTVMTPGQ